MCSFIVEKVTSCVQWCFDYMRPIYATQTVWEIPYMPEFLWVFWPLGGIWQSEKFAAQCCPNCLADLCHNEGSSCCSHHAALCHTVVGCFPMPRYKKSRQISLVLLQENCEQSMWADWSGESFCSSLPMTPASVSAHYRSVLSQYCVSPHTPSALAPNAYLTYLELKP